MQASAFSFPQVTYPMMGWRSFAAEAGIAGSETTAELAEDFDSVIEVRGDDPVKPLCSCADGIPFATDGGRQLARRGPGPRARRVGHNGGHGL